MLFENNPLSVVCSLVCDHKKQCEGHCVLARRGQGIHISSIENYISNAVLDTLEVPMAPKNGKMVAVIGAGPAGITIAIEMAKKGYSVTIFDSKDKIGGVLQYGIPDFRLPKTILARYKKKLEAMGILVRPNTTIGGALVIDDLGSENILKNVTENYLYNLLNERMTSGKLTFVSTNCGLDDLRERYGERIFSRLAGNSSLKINVGGNDLRLTKQTK